MYIDYWSSNFVTLELESILKAAEDKLVVIDFTASCESPTQS